MDYNNNNDNNNLFPCKNYEKWRIMRFALSKLSPNSNYFFDRNTTFLARQYNWSNMFNYTIITCRLSHYFRLKTCSSFLSHSQVFHLMFVIKYVTVLSGKYPANFTRIPDSAGRLHFAGYRIVLSGSGTSLANRLLDNRFQTVTKY